jgi:hypothetical protein
MNIGKTAFSVVFFFVASRCFAAAFDLIVPSDVQIRTQPGIVGVGTPWGWIVSTNSPLTFDDLKSMEFSLTTDNPSIVVTTTFYPAENWAPMMPGDVAGLDVAPFTTPLRALLRPGERINPLSENFWRWEIDFPEKFVGVAHLHTVAQLRGWSAVYDTTLQFDATFGTDMDPLLIVDAQRLSAVPEPQAVGLLSAAVIVIFAAGSSCHSMQAAVSQRELCTRLFCRIGTSPPERCIIN